MKGSALNVGLNALGTQAKCIETHGDDLLKAEQEQSNMEVRKK